MNKIIAVMNQKGGVGKTTTSINLSCGLAMEGNKVLLIDLDPQAHSTLSAGIEPGSFSLSTKDLLMDEVAPREVILETAIENLHVMPSHICLDTAEQHLLPQVFREARLHNAIKDLDYDYIVVDCRPSLGTLSINALYACDLVLVPCEVSRYSLDGFADLMKTIAHVKGGDDNNHKKMTKLVLTKFDSRTSVSNDWFYSELEAYKKDLLNTRIRQNQALNQAHIAMEPVFAFNPKSAGAEDYMNLTKEVMAIWQ